MNMQLAALTPGEVPGLIVRVLAVIGGAVLCGLLMGFLARFLTRLLTTRQMPLWAIRFVRLCGAVVGGWLVALLVFGGGGSGLGGGGGRGLGGAGQGTAAKDSKEPKPPEPPAKDNTQPNGGKTVVKVTVLAEEALKDITGTSKPDLERRYRIEGESPKALRSLAEIKEELLKRRMETPDLKVDVVLYEDSLSKETEQVRVLVNDFLVREKMFKGFDQLSRNAPR